MLLVAHDVNPILAYLDRVVYFAGGRGGGRARRGGDHGRDAQPPLRHADRGAARPPTAGSSWSGMPEAPAHHSDRPRATAVSAVLAAQPAPVAGTWSPTPTSCSPTRSWSTRSRPGTIVAVMAGVVGWFMVLRRQTFAGHTLSVIAFPGAAARAAGRRCRRGRLLRLLRRWRRW